MNQKSLRKMDPHCTEVIRVIRVIAVYFRTTHMCSVETCNSIVQCLNYFLAYNQQRYDKNTFRFVKF
jgi:hypothetical protein